jgi:hypothetical protein
MWTDPVLGLDAGRHAEEVRVSGSGDGTGTATFRLDR